MVAAVYENVLKKRSKVIKKKRIKKDNKVGSEMLTRCDHIKNVRRTGV